MNAWIKAVQGMALGTPMLLMLLGTHFYFTISSAVYSEKRSRRGYISVFRKTDRVRGISHPFLRLQPRLPQQLGREILSESLRQLQSEGRGRFSGVG